MRFGVALAPRLEVLNQSIQAASDIFQACFAHRDAPYSQAHDL